jgi:hypothetical protein
MLWGTLLPPSSLNPEEQFMHAYDPVSKSFRTVRVERELQMVQLSATRCSRITIL